jgi:hypothetical protein
MVRILDKETIYANKVCLAIYRDYQAGNGLSTCPNKEK